MKRVFAAALCCAALFAFAHRPASAMVEFCPASLHYEHVGETTALVREQSSAQNAGTAAPAVSSLYGFNLSALGPRTIVAARVAFDTSAGWFTADVPALDLVKKDRHYSSPSASFVRHDWISPTMYVRFPQAAAIAHAWVYGITVKNDALFGWDTLGAVTCPPPPAPSERQRERMPLPKKSDWENWMDPNDEDHLSVPPQQGSTIIRAVPSAALESAACDEPFRDAEVTSQAQPAYPEILRETFSGRAENPATVALEPDGALKDVWIWAPSGFDAFDTSAVHAAQSSQYSGARSYCQAVPSTYIFSVTFDSRM